MSDSTKSLGNSKLFNPGRVSRYQPFHIVQNSPVSKLLAKHIKPRPSPYAKRDPIKQLLFIARAAIFISRERRNCIEMFTEVQVGQVAPESDAGIKRTAGLLAEAC